MKENRIRRIIERGEVAIGTLISEFGTRGIPKILEYVGVDFVTLDMEHGSFGMERIADLIALFKSTDIAPIVRVPEGQYHFIARALDAGALGVQVPNVDDAEYARKIVAYAKYPPTGNRGLMLNASHTDFRPVGASYAESANQQTMIIVQIESEAAVRNVEEIAAVDGVDVLAIGYGDLLQSMGIFGQLDHPKFRAAVAATIEAARRHNKVGKIHPHSNEDIRRYVDMGYRMLMSNTDVAIFKKAAKESVDNLRLHAVRRG